MFQTHCTAVYFIYRVWSAALQEGPAFRAGGIWHLPGVPWHRAGGDRSPLAVPPGLALRAEQVPSHSCVLWGRRGGGRLKAITSPAPRSILGSLDVPSAFHQTWECWHGCDPTEQRGGGWLWAVGDFGELLLWGWHPEQARAGGSSWPQSCGGSAVLFLCLHSGDGAVKSRLLQKGTGHS